MSVEADNHQETVETLSEEEVLHLAKIFDLLAQTEQFK